jgi:hypothetical protein
MLGSSWVGVQLAASQEGLSSMSERSAKTQLLHSSKICFNLSWSALALWSGKCIASIEAYPDKVSVSWNSFALSPQKDQILIQWIVRKQTGQVWNGPLQPQKEFLWTNQGRKLPSSICSDNDSFKLSSQSKTQSHSALYEIRKFISMLATGPHSKIDESSLHHRHFSRRYPS